MTGDFERELQEALARVPAPAGFTDRVLAKLESSPAKRKNYFARYPALAAGVALLFTVGGIEETRHFQRMRAERAQRQVLFALRFTAEKLSHVNTRLQKSAAAIRIRGGESL